MVMEMEFSEKTRRMMESYEALTKSHTTALELHYRALCAHCECLAMNAENEYACSVGRSIPYGEISYTAVMKRWGLIDGKGNPLNLEVLR